MRTYVNIDGTKRFEDDDGNPIELEGIELKIAEATNAGGEVSAKEVFEILRENNNK